MAKVFNSKDLHWYYFNFAYHLKPFCYHRRVYQTNRLRQCVSVFEMDVVSLLLTVKDVIVQAHALYKQLEQTKENRTDAFELLNKLRHIQLRLYQFNVHGEGTSVSQAVLTDINADFVSIQHTVVSAIQNATSGKLTRVLNASDNHQRLQHALDCVAQCQARLETHGLIIDVKQSFCEEISCLRESLQQCMTDASASVTHELQQSMGAIRTALESIPADTSSRRYREQPPPFPFPPRGQLPSSSDISYSSCERSIDSLELESIQHFGQIPDSVQTIINDASRSGTSAEVWRNLLTKVTKVWNGWRIPAEHLRYELDVFNCPVQLGRGAFGVIYAASFTPDLNENNPSTVISAAVKHIDVPVSEFPKQKPDLLRSVFIQLSLDHQCILRTYGVCWPDEHMGETTLRKKSSTARIIMERMTHSLADAMIQGLVQKKDEKARVLIDVASALQYLHSHALVHRDLKPENVLLRFEDGVMIGFSKLADFGCSRRMYDDKVSRSFSVQTQASGTTLYLPPEVLRDSSRCSTRRSWDVWAYGMLLCSIWAPDHRIYINPWNASNLAQTGELGRNARDWALRIEEEQVRLLALRCLQEIPEERPTMLQVQLYQLGKIDADGLQPREIEFVSVDDLGNVSEAAKGSSAPSKSVQSILGDLTLQTGSIDEVSGLNSSGDKGSMEHIGIFVKRGFRFVFGEGAEGQRKSAAAIFRHAAACGNVEAIRCLGLCFEKGAGVTRDLTLSTGLFKDAAEKGNLEAMCNLGSCYRKGIGVEQSIDKAMALYKRSASTGCANGVRNMAFCFETGTGVVQDLKQAFELYQRAADAGNSQALLRIAYLYRSGTGVDVDIAKALAIYEEEARNGVAEGIHSLAYCYRTGTGVRIDITKALALYTEAGEGGSEGALCNVAYLHRTGSAVPRNDKLAFSLYKDIADAGSSEGRRGLAFCYREGIGVERDEARAAVISQSAVDGGNLTAMCGLAYCYRTGVGVPRDLKRVIALYRQAGDGGDGTGLCRLGVCYQTGVGVKRNVRMALQLFKRAVDAGNVEALRQIGMAYQNGLGVDVDLAQAKEMFRRAAEKGDSASRRKLKCLRTVK